jgi:hypothetical protein
MIRIIKFTTEYRPDGKAIDMVEFTGKNAMTPEGNTTHSTWERVDSLRPKPGHEFDQGERATYQRVLWSQIEPAYEAWKKGQDIPAHGTPLAAWSGLTPDQAERLKMVGMTTVEAIAEASEAVMANPPLPQMRELKKQAQMFLDSRESSAMAARLAELEEQNAAMLEMLAEKAEEPKRGPGRPKKAESEAA